MCGSSSLHCLRALDGVAIREIPTRLKSDILVCAVEREGGVIIPNGNFVLQTGDQVTFLATQEKAHEFFQRINLAVRPGAQCPSSWAAVPSPII